MISSQLVLQFLLYVGLCGCIEDMHCPYDDQRYSVANRGRILAIEDHKFGLLDRDTLDGVPAALPDLESLLIRNASVQVIAAGSFLQFRTLKCLDISSNFVPAVTSHTLWGLRGLNTLIMRHNQVHNIDGGTFSGLQQMTALDLSYNYLTLVSDSVFLNLDKLEELRLDANRLSFLSPHLFSRVPNLKVLTISRNPLLTIDLKSAQTLKFFDGSFTHLDRIPPLPEADHVSLNLSYSGFHKVPKSFLPRLRYIDKLWLKGNEWLCACDLAWFVQWAETTNKVLDLNYLECISPVTTPRMTLAIMSEQLNCNRSPSSEFYPIQLPFDSPNVPNSVLDVELTMHNNPFIPTAAYAEATTSIEPVTRVQETTSEEQTSSTTAEDARNKILKSFMEEEGPPVIEATTRKTKSFPSVSQDDEEKIITNFLQKNGSATTITAEPNLESKVINEETTKTDSFKEYNQIIFPSNSNVANVFVRSKVSVLTDDDNNNFQSNDSAIYIFNEGAILEKAGSLQSAVHNQSAADNKSVVMEENDASKGASESFQTNFTNLPDPVPSSAPLAVPPLLSTHKDSLSTPENPFAPATRTLRDFQAMIKQYGRSGRDYLEGFETKDFTEVIPIVTKFGAEFDGGFGTSSKSPLDGDAIKEDDMSMNFKPIQEDSNNFDNNSGANFDSKNRTAAANPSVLNEDTDLLTSEGAWPSYLSWIWLPICVLILLTVIIFFVICHRTAANAGKRHVWRRRIVNRAQLLSTVDSPKRSEYPNWSIPTSDNWTLLSRLQAGPALSSRHLHPPASRPDYSPPPAPSGASATNEYHANYEYSLSF